MTGRYARTQALARAHTHALSNTSLTLNSNEWHKKVQCWDVTFSPITQGWTDSINPWTKLVCYWHILTQDYQAQVFSQTVFVTHTHTHAHWVIRELLRFVGWVRCEDRCSTSWRLVNYITEMCLGNISETMTGVIKFSHTQSDCTTAMAHLNMLRRHRLVSVRERMSSLSQLAVAHVPAQWLVKRERQFPPWILNAYS